MENLKNVFIQVVQKPERRVIIKRGVKASVILLIVRRSDAMYGGCFRALNPSAGNRSASGSRVNTLNRELRNMFRESRFLLIMTGPAGRF